MAEIASLVSRDARREELLAAENFEGVLAVVRAAEKTLLTALA